MRAMGIDLGRPGGAVVMSDDQPGKPRCVRAMAVPRDLSDLEYQVLLHSFMKETGPDVIAAERPGFWGRAMIGMSQSRDDALATAAAQALQIRYQRFEPRHVKVMVAANGRASKLDMMAAVAALAHIEPETEHIADACALALVALKENPADRGKARRRSRRP